MTQVPSEDIPTSIRPATPTNSLSNSESRNVSVKSFIKKMWKQLFGKKTSKNKEIRAKRGYNSKVAEQASKVFSLPPDEEFTTPEKKYELLLRAINHPKTENKLEKLVELHTLLIKNPSIMRGLNLSERLSYLKRIKEDLAEHLFPNNKDILSTVDIRQLISLLKKDPSDPQLTDLEKTVLAKRDQIRAPTFKLKLKIALAEKFYKSTASDDEVFTNNLKDLTEKRSSIDNGDVVGLVENIYAQQDYISDFVYTKLLEHTQEHSNLQKIQNIDMGAFLFFLANDELSASNTPEEYRISIIEFIEKVTPEDKKNLKALLPAGPLHILFKTLQSQLEQLKEENVKDPMLDLILRD